jgi:hypothetical protein
MTHHCFYLVAFLKVLIFIVIVKVFVFNDVQFDGIESD